MKLFLLPLLVSLLPSVAYGQDIIGIHTRWSDSFRDWIIRTDQESREGTLEQRWKLTDNWSAWELRLGDTIAEIRLKWPDDPNLWEIRCMGVVVTARTLWRDNFLEWRLDDGEDRFVWRSRYGNISNEWILRDEQRGEFSVFTYWENDPREWVVFDNLEEDVSYSMRIAMVFLAVFHSTPKI